MNQKKLQSQINQEEKEGTWIEKHDILSAIIVFMSLLILPWSPILVPVAIGATYIPGFEYGNIAQRIFGIVWGVLALALFLINLTLFRNRTLKDIPHTIIEERKINEAKYKGVIK